MPDAKIGPCPWCKTQDENEQVVTREKLLYKCEPFQVYCSCGARGPHADTREEAIEKWNRASADLARAREEAVNSSLDEALNRGDGSYKP